MRPNAKDRDRAGDQHLARDDALALLHPGDVIHRLDLVLPRPALGREERIQPVGVSARIGVGYDSTALFVVAGGRESPPDLRRWKRNLKVREKVLNVQCRS